MSNKKWDVIVTFDASKVIRVSAKDAEQAKEKALNAAHVFLCHDCDREVTIGDPIDAIIVDD